MPKRSRSHTDQDQDEDDKMSRKRAHRDDDHDDDDEHDQDDDDADAPAPAAGLGFVFGRGKGGKGLLATCGGEATTRTWKRPSKVPPSVLNHWALHWLPMLTPDPKEVAAEAAKPADDDDNRRNDDDDDEDEEDDYEEEEDEEEEHDDDDDDDDEGGNEDDEVVVPPLLNDQGSLGNLFLYWRWRSAPILMVAIKVKHEGESGSCTVDYYEELEGYESGISWVTAGLSPQHFSSDREAAEAVMPFVRQLLRQNFTLHRQRISVVELERYRLPGLPTKPTSYDLEHSDLQQIRRGSLHGVKVADLRQYGFPSRARFGDVVVFSGYRNIDNFIVDQDYPHLWSTRNHTRVAIDLQEQVLALFLIRSTHADSVLALLPNELMFLVCEWLSGLTYPSAVEEPALFLRQSQAEYGYVLPPKFRPPWVPESYYSSFFDTAAEFLIEYLGNDVSYTADCRLEREFQRIMLGDMRG